MPSRIEIHLTPSDEQPQPIAHDSGSQPTWHRTYDDCPQCLQDWGMGLTYMDGSLVVYCVDCGFYGPGVSGDPSAKSDERAIALWNELPRDRRVVWTPAARLARILREEVPIEHE